MACAKLSVTWLLNRVFAFEARRSLLTMAALIVAWMLFSLFAIAFQCHLPTPWVFIPSQCPTHGYLQYVVIIFNILTDIPLALWILPSMSPLDMKREDRTTAAMLFGFRIIVPIVAIGQLWSLTRVLQSSDQTWVSFPKVLFDQYVP
jgi:hypothetical protein